jgi:hypothetical protein
MLIASKRRKRMKKLVTILIVLCIGCGMKNSSIDVQKTHTKEIQDVSLIQLIATPEKFHQTNVRVLGFAIIEFEGTAIYLSKEFAEYNLTKNAIWINIGLSEQFKQYDRKYVLIEGFFDKDDRGHLGMYSGALIHISRIEEWTLNRRIGDSLFTPNLG